MALTQVKTSGIADDAVTQDKVANDAIDITEIKAGVDGKIISYDASGNPVAVGPGTDGQVLTSTGAGSPPAFETLPTSGATLSGSTDNTVVTVTGSNAMQGEANLTYDGTTLKVGGDSGESGTWHLETYNGSGDGTAIIAGSTGAKLQLSDTGSSEKFVLAANGNCNVYSYKNDDDIIFNATTSSTTAEKFRVYANGNAKINDGDLVIGTSGHGIDFSATSGTGTSELLDDYEEGTFTPSSTFTTATLRGANYVKIGATVHCWIEYYQSGGNGAWSAGQKITGLPFTSATINSLENKPVLFEQYDTNDDMAFKTSYLNTSAEIVMRSAGGSVYYMWVQVTYQTTA